MECREPFGYAKSTASTAGALASSHAEASLAGCGGFSGSAIPPALRFLFFFFFFFSFCVCVFLFFSFFCLRHGAALAKAGLGFGWIGRPSLGQLKFEIGFASRRRPTNPRWGPHSIYYRL